MSAPNENLNETLDSDMIDISTSEKNNVESDSSINDAIQNTISGLNSLNEILNNSSINNNSQELSINEESNQIFNNNSINIKPDTVFHNNLNINNSLSDNINDALNSKIVNQDNVSLNNKTPNNIEQLKNMSEYDHKITNDVRDLSDSNNTSSEIINKTILDSQNVNKSKNLASDSNSNISQFNINTALSTGNIVAPTSNNQMDSNSNYVNLKDNTIDSTATSISDIKNSSTNDNIPTMKENDDFIDDDRLLEAFIGKNNEKILTKKFNFAAFFLNSIYMLYRKMFASSLIVFLIYLIIPTSLALFLLRTSLNSLSLLNSSTSYASNLLSLYFKIFLSYVGSCIVINIVLGFLFNKMYKKFSNKKISKIKLENSDKNQKELEIICSLKGGTSVEKVILGMYVQATIPFIIILVLSLAFSFSKSNFLINKTKSQINKNSYSSQKYNGWLLNNVFIDINKEYSIEVPSVFKRTSNDDYELVYEYEDTNSFNSCKFNFSSVNNYESADELIKQMAEYYKEQGDSSVKTGKIKINNDNWTWLSKGERYTYYYYGTTKNKKVYLFRYEIWNNTPSECEEYIKKALNSIKRK